MSAHPFVAWLREQPDVEFTTLTRDYAHAFPSLGGRAELRAALLAADGGVMTPQVRWNLACFDEAWATYDRQQAAAAHAMAAEHDLEDLL